MTIDGHGSMQLPLDEEKTLRGEPGIVTCSALKRSYRERLRSRM
jgi:gluconate kinase